MKLASIFTLSSLILAEGVATADAFACSRELMEWGQAEEGSLECLLDDSMAELLQPMGFQPNRSVSTEMVSANLAQAEGRPLISYLFHYSIYADQIDVLFRKWSEDRPAFETLANNLSIRVKKRICETPTGEASFLEAGGSANIVVFLTSADMGRNKFFYEKLASFALDTCEAP